MDIRVGAVVPVASSTEKALPQAGSIEAACRRPARAPAGGLAPTGIGGGRTARRKTADARVLVLMVPEGTRVGDTTPRPIASSSASPVL